MKTLFLMGLMLVGAAAQAQTVGIANNQLLDGEYSIGEYWGRMNDFQISYNFNKALGRAWVEVNISPVVNGRTNQEDYQLGLTGRWEVPGLRYDAATSKIFYNDVAVAEVKPGWLFGLGYSIQNINSELKFDVVSENVDDGFNVTKRLFEVVTLELK